MKTWQLADFDPWVTLRFPLGDPEFSAGSPRICLGHPSVAIISEQMLQVYQNANSSTVRLIDHCQFANCWVFKDLPGTWCDYKRRSFSRQAKGLDFRLTSVLMSSRNLRWN